MDYLFFSTAVPLQRSANKETHDRIIFVDLIQYSALKLLNIY